MTRSPSATSTGTRFPESSMRPGPTATTLPSCGFSLAVSGMTRPDAVVLLGLDRLHDDPVLERLDGDRHVVLPFFASLVCGWCLNPRPGGAGPRRGGRPVSAGARAAGRMRSASDEECTRAISTQSTRVPGRSAGFALGVQEDVRRGTAAAARRWPPPSGHRPISMISRTVTRGAPASTPGRRPRSSPARPEQGRVW